ncbi:hypothetical protein [Lacisediminihabitans sp. H27-G8]|uniref:hypothetical protein n=1 Tax=Lacisediminihabitans sp. H27-G8 TaxID=3111909 RepID=UPI0038FC7A2C
MIRRLVADGVPQRPVTKDFGVGRSTVDLAAAWLDVDESAFEVRVTIKIPEPAARLFAHAKKYEETAREAVSVAARQWRETVRVTIDALWRLFVAAL